MKKYLPILVGVLAAVMSATLIYFRKDIGDTGTVKAFAQVTLPILLAVVIAFVPGTMKQKFIRLGIMLGSFFILLSMLEPFAFKYWVTQTTPAGSVYSRYDMDAFYPWLGLVIILFAWIVGLVLVLAQDVFQRVLQRARKPS